MLNILVHRGVAPIVIGIVGETVHFGIRLVIVGTCPSDIFSLHLMWNKMIPPLVMAYLCVCSFGVINNNYGMDPKEDKVYIIIIVINSLILITKWILTCVEFHELFSSDTPILCRNCQSYAMA